MSEQPDRLSPLTGLGSRHAWLDNLVRAGERYTETHGNHYAAAITYFSVLALVPLLMIAFASVALVLKSNPDLLARLKAELGRATSGWPTRGGPNGCSSCWHWCSACCPTGWCSCGCSPGCPASP